MSVAVVALFVSSQLAGAATCRGTIPTGLDPSGQNDNTSAIQAAIDTASANGGGTVMLPIGRYLVTGTLNIKNGVTLCGGSDGPFEVFANPATGPVAAATLLVTHTTPNPNWPDAPFIYIGDSNINTAVTDLVFHYPCQKKPDCNQSGPPSFGYCPASPYPPGCEPRSYPPTIQARQPTRIERITAVNAYNFLDIQVGRVVARDLYIGALMVGISIDNALDRVSISNVQHGVFWDMALGFPWPPVSLPSMDVEWVRQHSIAFVIQRADSLAIDNAMILNRYSGFYFTPNAAGGMAYGVATNVDLDGCQYCIQARGTHGFIFTNTFFYGGSNDIFGSGVWAVWPLEDGQPTYGPKVEINGGVISGTWTGGSPGFDVSNPLWGGTQYPGKLVVKHVFGYDEP